MTLVPYADHQPAPAGWIGQIPAHWDVEKIKFSLSEKGKVIARGLPAGAISYGRVVRKDGDKILPETLASYQEVRAGEFLINPINLNYDLVSLRTALSDIDVAVSPAYIVLRADGAKLDSRYGHYLLHIFDIRHMKTLGAGIRQTIGFQDIGNCHWVLPPLVEQTVIASYLDRESERLETLIEKKKRFILLLKEKRAALITSSVTKGLNCSVPMIDSGLLCMGKHPEHWPIMRIGQVFRQRSEKVSDRDFAPLSVTKKGILPQLDHVAKTDDNDNRKLVRSGDFVINSRSDRKGSAGIAEQNGSVSLINTVLIPSDLIDPRFCHHLFRSTAFQEEFYRMGSGLVADLWSTNFSTMKRISFALPPKDEQRAIGAFLDREIDRMDGLISKAERSIELIREHRTALITAAVTGKIDVRNAA